MTLFLLPFHFFNVVLILTVILLLCCFDPVDRQRIATYIQGSFGTPTPPTEVFEETVEDTTKMD